LKTDLARIVVVTGHYGSGKTNLAINLAVDFRGRGEEVVLADLDIVNPYFRTADFRERAGQLGISLVASPYAGSTLDIPALTGELDARLGSGQRVIIDVGGDDAGACALGRYAPRLWELTYSMLYVVNCFRHLTMQPREAVGLLTEIEGASRLRATHIVGNGNLAGETTPADVRKAMAYDIEVARMCSLPLAFHCVERSVAGRMGANENVYPVDIYVTSPWNTEPGGG